MKYKTLKTSYKVDEINAGDFYDGKYSFLIKRESIDKYIPGFSNFYKYPDATLKVFKRLGVIETYRWGDDKDRENSSNSLIECSQIQNMLYQYNLAPRVYDLVYLKTPERIHVCQVVGEATGVLCRSSANRSLSKWYLRTMMYLFDVLGIECFYPDSTPFNFISGKLVDFQGLRFKDKEKLKKELLKRINLVAGWGPIDDPYQSVEMLGHKGRRVTDKRVQLLGLDKENFTNKSVLDIGCSAGMFGNYAAANGARVVYGFDMPEIARLAQDLANFLGIFNVNYLGYDLRLGTFKEYLRDLSGEKRFDIVFFLSMFRHIGYPQHIDSLVGNTLYFEGHGETPAMVDDLVGKFKQRFNKVEVLGYSEDFNKRLLFKATR